MEAYRFSPLSRTASTVEEFVEGCRAEPKVACDHLQQGYFEPWLRDAGRSDLEDFAKYCRLGGTDAQKAFDEFLNAATRALAFDPKGWPAAALAFDFVRPSYELLARRFEAVENRGRALATFAGTIMFTAPAFALAVQGRAMPSLTSVPFLVALFAFAGVIAPASRCCPSSG